MREAGEHNEQATLMEWVRLNIKTSLNHELREALELFYAIPNGAYLSKTQRVKMSREGRIPGVLDLSLDCAGERIVMDGKRRIVCFPYHGLRIEMKYRKGPISAKIQSQIDAGDYLVDLSKEQKRKRELLIKAGYQVKVCYSADQAIKVVRGYLSFDKSDYQGIKEFSR